MSCQPAPVALRARDDCIAAFGGKVFDDGIVASAAHSADCYRSSHNCASTCGGQESGNYNGAYAHAWDAGHAIGDIVTALAVRIAFLADSRVRYVIDRGILYYPDGSWSHSTGHEDHDHMSFLPGTTFDTRPFTFTTSGGFGTMTDDQIRQEFANQDDRIVARVVAELAGTERKPGKILGPLWKANGMIRSLQKKAGIPVGSTVKEPK